MENLHVIDVVGERGEGSSSYVLSRTRKSYSCTSSFVEYAFLGSKEACEARLKLMRKKNYTLGTAVVRPINEDEWKRVKEHRHQESEIKKFMSMRTKLDVSFCEENSSVAIFFKKKPNRADRAMMSLFKQIGLTIRGNNKGHKFVSVKVEE